MTNFPLRFPYMATNNVQRVSTGFFTTYINFILQDKLFEIHFSIARGAVIPKRRIQNLCQTSNMERSAKIVMGIHTNFTKHSILDENVGSENVSALWLLLRTHNQGLIGESHSFVSHSLSYAVTSLTAFQQSQNSRCNHNIVPYR